MPLELQGKTNIRVQVGQIVHDVEFQVISGTGRPLIGHKSATDLGLLHIGMINSVSPRTSSQNETTDTIVRSFEDRFTGTGKLKDFQLELHVDQSVQPVAQALRQTPFKMRKQISDKIDELVKCDFIETSYRTNTMGVKFGTCPKEKQ